MITLRISRLEDLKEIPATMNMLYYPGVEFEIQAQEEDSFQRHLLQTRATGVMKKHLGVLQGNSIVQNLTPEQRDIEREVASLTATQTELREHLKTIGSENNETVKISAELDEIADRLQQLATRKEELNNDGRTTEHD